MWVIELDQVLAMMEDQRIDWTQHDERLLVLFAKNLQLGGVQECQPLLGQKNYY